MLRILALLFGCCLIVLRSIAQETFDRSDERTQASIVGELRDGLRDGDIMIVQSRADEIYREEEPIPRGQLDVLNLRPLRFVKSVKGDIPLTHADRFFVYWIDIRPEAPWRLYHPFLAPDDLMRILIMRRQPEPVRERIADRNLPEFSPFAKDGGTMPMPEFMRKYDLTSFFSNRVYRLAGGCAFVVDYPEPVVEARNPETRERVAAENARIRANQKVNGTVGSWLREAFKLSNREASEIVYVAYLLDGKEGPARYAAAAKGDPLLEPMERGDFKTNLGRRLYEAVRTELGEINTARGSQH